MIEIKHVLEDIDVNGISICTNNHDEMSGKGKIPALWANFDANVTVDYRSGNRVFGIYDNYESDENGNFDVWACTNQPSVPSKIELSTKTIPKGKYLVFTETGNMPQIAIDAWTKVWEYFTSDSCSHTRSFSVDYELYASDSEIHVHIGIE